jgi:hypothetical protein
MKRSCVESLATALRAVVPAGVDVQACAADWEEPTKFPAVRVLPGKFTFDPWQEQEVDDTQATNLFLEVGEFEGNVEIRVSARHKIQREQIEDTILNWFLSRAYTPGVQVTTLPSGQTVGGIATTYQANCAFSLEDEEWREEMVFADKRYSFLDVEAWFPALVVRTGVSTIQSLRLVMEADVAADVTVTTPNASAEEGLLVADDGTTTKINPP